MKVTDLAVHTAFGIPRSLALSMHSAPATTAVAAPLPGLVGRPNDWLVLPLGEGVVEPVLRPGAGQGFGLGGADGLHHVDPVFISQVQPFGDETVQCEFEDPGDGVRVAGRVRSARP